MYQHASQALIVERKMNAHFQCYKIRPAIFISKIELVYHYLRNEIWQLRKRSYKLAQAVSDLHMTTDRRFLQEMKSNICAWFVTVNKSDLALY